MYLVQLESSSCAVETLGVGGTANSPQQTVHTRQYTLIVYKTADNISRQSRPDSTLSLSTIQQTTLADSPHQTVHSHCIRYNYSVLNSWLLGHINLDLKSNNCQLFPLTRICTSMLYLPRVMVSWFPTLSTLFTWQFLENTSRHQPAVVSSLVW